MTTFSRRHHFVVHYSSFKLGLLWIWASFGEVRSIKRRIWLCLGLWVDEWIAYYLGFERWKRRYVQCILGTSGWKMKEKICLMHLWNQGIMKCTTVNSITFDFFKILESFFMKLPSYIDRIPNRIQTTGEVSNNTPILSIWVLIR